VGDAQTLETRSKGEEGYDAGDIVFVLITYLNIPNVEVRPSIDEVQNMLNNAGKIIISVTKGVSQWKNIRKKNGKVPGFVPNCDSVKERKLYSAVKTEKPLIDEQQSNFFKAVFRIRIRIHRIHVFFVFESYYFVTLFDFLSLKNNVNIPSKSKKQKKLC
jgi:hypothetical protein